MKLFLAVVAAVFLLGAIIPGPPHSVWVHGQRWQVVYVKSLRLDTLLGPEAYAGITLCEERVIAISQEEDPEDWPEILLHEATHAATCGSDNEVHNDVYNSSADGDHPGIERIAQEELRFLRENPRVVQWIEVTR